MSRDPHSRQSMRAVRRPLEHVGEFLGVCEPFACELGTAARCTEADRPASCFSHIEELWKSGVALVGNLLNSLLRFAAGLGTKVEYLRGMNSAMSWAANAGQQCLPNSSPPWSQ